MRNSNSGAGRHAYYSLSDAAWLLGVERSVVARAVRVGTLRAVWRRGRFVIPADALAELLAGQPEQDERSGEAP